MESPRYRCCCTGFMKETPHMDQRSETNCSFDQLLTNLTELFIDQRSGTNSKWDEFELFYELFHFKGRSSDFPQLNSLPNLKYSFSSKILVFHCTLIFSGNFNFIPLPLQRCCSCTILSSIKLKWNMSFLTHCLQ